MELQQAIEEITGKIDCITAEDFGEGYKNSKLVSPFATVEEVEIDE